MFTYSLYVIVQEKSMKTPIEVFSDWVDIGKDEGMEKTITCL